MENEHMVGILALGYLLSNSAKLIGMDVHIVLEAAETGDPNMWALLIPEEINNAGDEVELETTDCPSVMVQVMNRIFSCETIKLEINADKVVATDIITGTTFQMSDVNINADIPYVIRVFTCLCGLYEKLEYQLHQRAGSKPDEEYVVYVEGNE